MDEQILAVQRMQDYIAAHLTQPITLAALARASHYSPWHAYRLFLAYTGISPAEYVRKCRLSRSALKLRDKPEKIADIALALGFGSVDGYQRAFAREFGCNPSEYAAHPVPLPLFTPYDVKFRYLERSQVMAKVQSIFIQRIEKPARKALIKRGKTAKEYFTYCEEVGCDVWGLLKSIPALDGEPVGMWLPAAYIRPGASQYVQGAEVSAGYDGIVPEGLELIDLPAASYLMFQGEPFAEEDYHEAICQIQSAIERYQPDVIGYQWDEQNPRIQLEPIGSRGYIELVPVRQKG